jgi:hypothetical protein
MFIFITLNYIPELSAYKNFKMFDNALEIKWENLYFPIPAQN